MTSAQSQHASAQSDHGLDILRSFKEWLKVQQARGDRASLEIGARRPSERHNEAAWKEFYYSPSISTSDRWIDQNPRQVDFEADATSSKRQPVGRRLFRAASYGFSIIVVVGVVVGWQTYGDRINMRTAWELSLSWPSLFLHTTGSDGISPEVQNRVDTLASDLTAVRRSVEELAAKQEQITRDIDAAGGSTEHQPKNFIAASLSGPPRSAAQIRAKQCALGSSRTVIVSAGANSALSTLALTLNRPVALLL